METEEDEGSITKQIFSLVLKETAPFLISILVINLLTIFLVVQISKRI